MLQSLADQHRNPARNRFTIRHACAAQSVRNAAYNPPLFHRAIRSQSRRESAPLPGPEAVQSEAMESAPYHAFYESLPAAMPQLSEKPHQGVQSRNQAWNQGPNVPNSTTALGLRAALHLERVRSRYTGKERDSESGNDYFGARYYASSMGRMLSPDPSQLYYADPEDPQGLNLYSYVLNNPLSFIDPDGLECVWDDGSFDSKDDKQTGSNKSCGKAGGTWIDPKAFSTLNAGDWSDKANSTIAGIAQDLNSTSTTVTVTAQDPGVVGALPLETPQVTQQIDPIKQLAIGITLDSQHSFGCIAQAYGVGVPGTAGYQLGQPTNPKPFAGKGAMPASSHASEALAGAADKLKVPRGRYPSPVGGPGTGMPFKMRTTPNAGRAAGRWLPIVGLAADAYAAAQLWNCLGGN